MDKLIYEEVKIKNIVSLNNNECLIVASNNKYNLIYANKPFEITEYINKYDLNKKSLAYKIVLSDYNYYFNYRSDLLSFSGIINFNLDFPITFIKNNSEIFSKEIQKIFDDKYKFKINSIIKSYLVTNNIKSDNTLFKSDAAILLLEEVIYEELRINFLIDEGISNFNIKINRKATSNESVNMSSINPFLR